MFETETPPGSTPAERRRAATRAEILEHAWRLCRDEGLAGLSMRSLAARVGMRAPSLYSYFASKDAIYDAMFADGYRELARATQPELDSAPVSRATFRAQSRRFAEFCVADPVRYQLLFQRTIPGFEPSEASYALAVEYLDRLVAALASLGVSDRRYVDLWTAMISGLIAQQLSNEPTTDRWTRLVDEAVDLFCNHLGILPE